jgi:hypothetical protein
MSRLDAHRTLLLGATGSTITAAVFAVTATGGVLPASIAAAPVLIGGAAATIEQRKHASIRTSGGLTDQEIRDLGGDPDA